MSQSCCLSVAELGEGPDEGKRKKWMEWVKEQLNTQQVALVIVGLKPRYHRSEAVATYVC